MNQQNQLLDERLVVLLLQFPFFYVRLQHVEVISALDKVGEVHWIHEMNHKCILLDSLVDHLLGHTRLKLAQNLENLALLLQSYALEHIFRKLLISEFLLGHRLQFFPHQNRKVFQGQIDHLHESLQLTLLLTQLTAEINSGLLLSLGLPAELLPLQLFLSIRVIVRSDQETRHVRVYFLTFRVVFGSNALCVTELDFIFGRNEVLEAVELLALLEGIQEEVLPLQNSFVFFGLFLEILESAEPELGCQILLST